MREVDVVVLGAGIGGSVAAGLMSREGYRVAIISQDAGTKNHLPESWDYKPLHRITNLGSGEKILSTLKKQSHCCFCSADGRRSVEMTVTDVQNKIEIGDLVQVDRNQFDRVLLESALEAGAKFFPMSTLERCEISSSGVATCISKGGELHEFTSSFIIDATGKRAFLSNHLKLPTREETLDTRVACFSHFETPASKVDGIRIVAIEGGYLFCIPISDQKLSVGCVLAERLVDLSASPEKIFGFAISLSPYVTELLAGAKRVLPVIPAKNTQKICLEPAGPRYRLVGDAAAFLDPFFCPGIDFALFSAEQAALTIEEDSALGYQRAIMDWLEESKRSVYQKMENSEWGAIMRLFADPHLPFTLPLMLTQAFTQIVGAEIPLNVGIKAARRAYDLSSY